MKRIGITLVVLAFMAACQQRTGATAGEQTSSPEKKVHLPGDTLNTTSIQWIDSIYQDLGTVSEGPEVDIAFKFRNTGKKNLVIDDVTAGCGCTIVEKPQEPFPPGETGTIRAKFTTSGHIGTNEKSIYVVSNTKGNPNQELRFKVVVEKTKS
jgi:Protein of unknown function (DUF1573)